jgi:predicted nucleic acid-binding protein
MGWCLRIETLERIAAMKGFVLDTSVVLKWFSEFGESDLPQAIQLRQALLDGSVLFTVPELLFYELSNALRYNPSLSSRDVQEALDSVIDMGLVVKGVDKRVMAEAISIAFKYGVTVYDAYFLALSRIERKPLIIADYRFAEKVKASKEILRLSDLASDTLKEPK